MAMRLSASSKTFSVVSKYIKDKILLHRHYSWLLDCITANFAVFNGRKFEKTFDHAGDAISVHITSRIAMQMQLKCLRFDTEMNEYWHPMVNK
jgi:hypothetical protein